MRKKYRKRLENLEVVYAELVKRIEKLESQEPRVREIGYLQHMKLESPLDEYDDEEDNRQ